MKYFDLEGRKGIGGIYVGLEIYTDQVQLEHVNISNAASEGIYIKTPASTTFTFNFIDVSSSGNGREGIYLEARDGSVLNFNLNGGNISNNGYSGIYTYTMGGAIFPHLSNLTINANGVAPTSWAQKQGLQLSYENVNPILKIWPSQTILALPSIGIAMVTSLPEISLPAEMLPKPATSCR